MAERPQSNEQLAEVVMQVCQPCVNETPGLQQQASLLNIRIANTLCLDHATQMNIVAGEQPEDAARYAQEDTAGTDWTANMRTFLATVQQRSALLR